MKEGIHPDYREVVFADLQTGSKFITRSTVQTRETIELDGKTYPLFKCDVTSNRTRSTRAPRPASSKPAAWKSSAPASRAPQARSSPLPDSVAPVPGATAKKAAFGLLFFSRPARPPLKGWRLPATRLQ